MLSQEFVLVLLQASITGAGLVLAVYTLIIPLYRRNFGYRAEEVYEELQELKDKIRETDTRISQEELSELKALLMSVEERHAFPTYLSWGAGITFFGYVTSTLISIKWILDYNKPTMNSLLPLTFSFSTIFFLLLGLVSIKDISQTMKREFEDLKKKVEEAKSKAEISVKII